MSYRIYKEGIASLNSASDYGKDNKKSYSSTKESPPKRGKADTDLDPTVKMLELRVAALKTKHNAIKRTCREMNHRLCKSVDKCNTLHKENQSAKYLLHHNQNLKEIHSECEEKNYKLEDFEFGHNESLRPIVSLSRVSSLASFEDDTYVNQLQGTLKRVNVGKLKEHAQEMTLVHMLRRNEVDRRRSSTNAESKRAELNVTCKKLEKHQHVVLKARHLRKVAFENKANFEQYVENNRDIWMKKILHRRTYVQKLKQAHEKLKRKVGAQKSGKEHTAMGLTSAVLDFEYNVLQSRFEKLQKAIGTTDLTFIAGTICETIQGTSNLNGKVNFLKDKLDTKYASLKDLKVQMNSLQLHGSTDFAGTYRKVEQLEEEFQRKVRLLKQANEREKNAQKMIYSCSSYFSRLTQQLQPFKIDLATQSLGEQADGNELETSPDVLKTLQICESKLDLLSRLEAHNFNMSEVLKDQQMEDSAQQMRLAARRDSSFVPDKETKAMLRKFSTFAS